MAGITLSAAVRDNLLSIQGTAKLLGQTQSRLASGLKVQSAIDDPTAFFTAQSLSNRASDLNTLLDNEGLAIQTLKAADEGIKSIQNLVNQAKATANAALNTVISSTTENSDTGLGNATVLARTAAGVASTVTLTITVDGNATTITAKALTLSKLTSRLNGLTGLAATLSGGQIFLSAASGRDITFAGSFATGLGLVTSTNGTNRLQSETDFNNLLTQIDQLTTDTGFNGVNLLNGNSLTVKFNETGTSTLAVTGVTFDAAGIGATTVAVGGFGTDSAITAKLTQLDAATSTLRTQASTFGGNLSVVENRQSFTSNLINVLETGAAGLTLADTNEEGANLLALQTRQQLGSVALSLASQADQNVLRLF